MKYQLLISSVARPCIQVGNNNHFFFLDSPDFAAHVCGELNRLDAEVNRLTECLRPKVTFFGGSVPNRHAGVEVDGERYLLESIFNENLAVQVEAKCKALDRAREAENIADQLRRDVTHLEHKLFEANCEGRSFEQRLGVRTGQVRRLLTALEHAQAILAAYVQPEPHVKPKSALNDLLGVLDDGELVTMMRKLREWLGVKEPASQHRGESPLIVHADQVFINGEAIDSIKSTIGQTDLAAELRERVVNNTTNHFEPKKKHIRRVVIETIRKELKPGGLLFNL